MKKIVLLSGLLAFAAQADNNSTSARDAVEGFYAGLGVCWDYSINKIGSTHIPGVPSLWDGKNILHKKSGKIGGSLVVGYGTFVTGNFYLGGEAVFDIAGNKIVDTKYVDSTDNEHKCQARIKGFVPSIAIRLGGWCSPIDSLIYTKMGGAFVRAEYQDKTVGFRNDIRKMSRFAPVIGLGIEKNVYDNFNVRLEGDYRFQVKKEDWTVAAGGAKMGVENRFKGFTIRLMATCKF